MRTAAIAALLGVAVLAAWLAAAGFWRLRFVLDRLHVATFLNAVSGGAITLAVLLADGFSQRAGKVVLIWALSLLGGAAVSHATGRALLLRGSTDQEKAP